MKYKISFGVFVVLGFLLCLFPFEVKAAGEPYEVGIKYYSVGDSFDPTYTEDWLDQFQDGSISELTNTTLQPGDTFVVAVTLKTIDTTNANSMAFALYYRYDMNLIQIADVDTTALFDKRISTRGGIFPTSSWNYDVLNTDNVGEVAITFRDTKTSAPTVFTNTEEGPVAFVFFTVKDDAVAGETIDFTWITDLNDTDGLYTMGSTSDAQAVDVKTVDSSILNILGTSENDTTLTSLTVSNSSTNYILDPEFVTGSTTTAYSTVVPANIDTVRIDATATSGEITPAGLGEKSLIVGNNHFEFIVMAKDGTSQIYSIDVKRLSSVATLDTLSLSGVTLNEIFNANIFDYTANVSYQTNSTTVIATATTPAMIKEGTGDVTFANVGLNTVTVVVEAENCKTEYASVVGNSCTSNTYQVNITKAAASSDATLSKITIDGEEVLNFTSDTIEYTLDAVKNDVTSLTVIPTVKDPNATYVVNGDTNFVIGENTITIVVTAEDNITTKTYTLKVKRQSNDATLQSLTLTSNPQGVLSPTFDALQTSYTYTYDENVDIVHIAAVANDANAQGVTPDQDYVMGTDTQAVITVIAEDGTTGVYTVRFERKQSTVSTLKSLEVKSGATSYPLTPVFSEGVLEYAVTIPNEVSQVTIEASATSEYSQSIIGLGEVNLQVGENTQEVEITAEDGTSKTKYIVNITREQSNNAYLTDIQVDGVSISGFDKDNFTYTLDAVSSTTTTLNLTYTQENQDSTVEILDNTLMEGQTNVVKLKVTSQDQSQTNEYLLTVRRKSSNANLTNIHVTSTPQGTLSPMFSENETEYTYAYDRSVKTIQISVNQADSVAAVTGAREYNVETEAFALITVTPEDGNIKTYRVNFEQILESDSSLQTLTIKNGTITYSFTPTFASDTLAYTIDVPNATSEVIIEAMAKGSHIQGIEGLGEVSLQVGTNTKEVVVTAEDGTQTTYTLTINRAISTDASLTSLQVDGVEVPNFRADQTEYTLDAVSYAKDMVEISATGSLNSSVIGTGAKSLAMGENTFEVEVTAQDGVTKTIYRIHIRRKSNDASLTQLAVTSTPQGTLNPTFDKTTKTYTLNIPASVDVITVVATPASGARIVNPDDLADIMVESITEIVVSVMAEDTNYSDSYTIMIQREKDTNANLATLAVSEGMLTPVFSANIDDYTVEVGSEITSLEITATADDPKATISGDRGVQNLQFGDNPFTITVTAEDQVTTKNYTVTVKRAKKNDATLRDLTVDGVTVTGFDPLQDRYEMEVANNISAITILATANDNNATIRQNTLGIKPLVVGDNVFTINVTAHDGTTTKTYQLTIHRKASSDHSITSLMVFGKAALWNGQDGKYEVEVDYAIQQLTPDDIVAILPQGATIDKGTGMNLVTGANTYTISVRAEDGTKKSYTMEITRNLSNDSSLRDLTIYGQTPTFNDVDKQYELEVENTVTTLTPDDISATVSAGATLNKGMGANLIVGQNNYSIMVTAGNGNVETYRIVITRKAPLLSTDSSLVSLEVTGYPLTPSFKQTTLSYSIGNIGYDVNELTVVATTSDTKSSIRYYVNDTLQTSNVISLPNQEGAATIKVEIMAEDTTTTEYIINYVKKSNISYQITSNVHTIIGDNIQTVKLDTTGIEIKNQLDNPSEYLEIWTADEARKVEDGEKLATGMIVKLMIDGIERDRKYIVIKGDADGDGLIDLLDAVKILNHYLSRTMLTGPYYEAAQVMEDADIDLLDSVMILNHYLGRSLLH